MANVRIKDLARTVSVPKTSEFIETDHATDGSGKLDFGAFVAALPAFRNALAPRGALAFDGTAGTRVYSTLTNQNIGTDAFSVSMVVEVPTAVSVDQGLVNLASHATVPANAANAFYVELKVAGNMVAYVQGASTSDVNSASVGSVVSTYGGKRILLTIVRPASGNLAIYINGVAQSPTYGTTGTPPTWQGSITSTYLGLGYQNSSQLWKTVIYSASVYNLALSQADVTEIYELGGAVPFRFQWGNQTELIGNGNFASSTGWGLDTGWAISGGAATATAISSGQAYRTNDFTLQPGKAYRTKFTISAISSGAVRVELSGTGSTSEGTNRTTTGTFVEVLTVGVPTLTSFVSLEVAGGSTTATVDDFSVVRAGAVVHYDADLDGIGYQLHDQSTNKLHALLTTTGVSWSKAATMGYVKVLSDGTTSAQALGGGTILPANCQIIRVRARSISGTPSITLGTSSGGSQIVASVALSTTWKDLTIALTGGINTTAASLWMTASAANVVEVQLAYEQLPA